MSAPPPGRQKRKRVSLTLGVKAEILRKMDAGERSADLAKYYGVGRATIHDLKHNRQRIESFMEKLNFNLNHRHTLKYGEFPQIEESVYEWIVQQRAKNVLVTGELIQEKAKQFYKQLMKKDDFKASTGWLDKFKKRYGIRLSHTNMNGDKTRSGSSEKTILPAPLKKFQEKLSELALVPDQVYSIEASTLFWKSIPQKISENRVFKDRVAFLACCNTSGAHKVDLFCVGRSRITKDVRYPIKYVHQDQLQITREVFLDWFNEFFAPSVSEFLIKQKLPLRALLIVRDDLGLTCEDVVHSQSGFYQAIFLPKDYDEDLTKLVRDRYRKSLLYTLIAQKENFIAFLTELPLEEVLFDLAYAWQSISFNTVIALWHKLWPSHPLMSGRVAITDSMERESLHGDLRRAVAQLWQNVLSMMPRVGEIEDWLLGGEEDALDLLEGDNECVDVKMEVGSDEADTKANEMGFDEVLSAFNTCIKWCARNDMDGEDILTLKRLQEKFLMESFVPNEDTNTEIVYIEQSDCNVECDFPLE